MAMVESALGADVAVGPFPPGRSPNAPCEFPRNGLSTVSAVRRGWPGSRGGDLGAATPVSGDRDLGEVEQLDPIRRGSHPAAVAASVVSADVLPSPAVRITLCHTKFSRELMVCLATACLK